MAFFQWALAEWVVKALYKDALRLEYKAFDKALSKPTDKDALRLEYEAFDKAL